MIFVIFSPAKLINAEEEENYYTVLLEEHEEWEKARKIIQENNIEIVYSVEEINVFQVKATQEKMNRIGYKSFINTYNESLRFSNVSNKANKIETLENPMLWENQWDMKKVTNDGKSYDVFSGSKNVTVGIIDSGVDSNHPDLKGNIVPGSKNLVPNGGFRGKEKSETGDINYFEDKTGHGTFTAGQIAANGNIKGIAPNIGIKSYRVFGEGLGESIWIIKGIIQAAKDDVDVINLSLGQYLVDGKVFLNSSESKKDLAEIKAYKRAIKFARNEGSVVVAAAGNDSLNVNDSRQMNEIYKKKNTLHEVSYTGKVLDVPAALPNVVTVSSVGLENELSVFSNYGEGFIDIAAPGGDLKLFNELGIEQYYSSGAFKKEQVVGTAPGGGYSFSVGNSVAAPKVSGALALIIDKKNYKNQPNKSTNFLYQHGVNGYEEKYSFFGHGTLDVYKAVTH
ncbi:peptidase S8 [Bacillus cereus]|nr:peptidase S8 [Bacillus cereus]